MWWNNIKWYQGEELDQELEDVKVDSVDLVYKKFWQENFGEDLEEIVMEQKDSYILTGKTK